MPLQLLPLPLSEFDIYARVGDVAFRPGICSVLYANGMTPEGIRHAAAKAQRYEQKQPGRMHFFKIMDTDLSSDGPFGQVIAVAQWKVFAQRSEEEIKQEEEEENQDEEQYGTNPDIAPGNMLNFLHELHRVLDACRMKHLGNKPYVLLHALCTLPEHERRGAGSLALEWGAAKADELGLPAYLEGSPKGVPLYKKFGFEVVESLPLDARDFGYHEALTHMCMLRQPNKE
ncbi:unnamed protein product [Zymoseptoria tritici ST99CH_3D7]|uniref:N-acetyltransferase domain-containing protein n=2 Tax=Zymoseptoria tritici TaxID=1047171 RepID=A0A1X7S5Q1_ZYMT9|nr:unnamed protein product [Zymoseptoria tritici ST99CH_3D7]SMR60215.1 unnamed protein product [Zymoseptoria tritici ST99CH_1E4]